MIIATWFGGPRDGELVELQHCNMPLRVLKPRKPYMIRERGEDLSTAAIMPETMDITPELTMNGWILRWRESD